MFCCFIFVCGMRGQELKEVDEARRREIIREVDKAASSLKTMQCDFVQTKRLSMLNEKIIAHGKMYYLRPGLLRWEYTRPYTYTFVLNGSKVMLKSAQKKDLIDVKSSRLFQEIVRIMMNSVTGKCLSEADDFRVTIHSGTDTWIARLTPQKKEMKQMFRHIVLHLDRSRMLVNAVEMVEKSGDTTLIELKNIRTNAPVDEKIFALD